MVGTIDKGGEYVLQPFPIVLNNWEVWIMDGEKIINENEETKLEQDQATNIDDTEINSESELKDAEESVEEVSVEKLQAEIAQLKEQLEEKTSRNLRLQADMENLRRRTKLDLQMREKYRAQSLITDLLPVIDNFDRALQTDSTNEEVKSLLTGVEMVYNSLLEALKTEGAEPIEAVGQPFDPNFHEAVMQVEEEGYESNVVVEEFQKGYLLKDRVIRPSMVKVNK